ncbi:hypothetical protein FRB97_003956 [Tulasnella sp. 331]|nr:hypothetical protein FRB97_003956 [Tulasnella sp. 331]
MRFPHPNSSHFESQDYDFDEAEQQDCSSSNHTFPFPQDPTNPFIPFPQPDLRGLPLPPSNPYPIPPTYGNLNSTSYSPSPQPSPRACAELPTHQPSLETRDRGFGDEVHRDLERVGRWVKRKFHHHDHGRKVVAPSATAAPSHHEPNHHPVAKQSPQDHQHWVGSTPGPISHITFPMPDANAHVCVQAYPPYPYWPMVETGAGNAWGGPNYR